MLLLPVLISLIQTPTQSGDVCPEKIQVSAAGEVFTDRFNGRYRTSVKLLESDLRGGCYNDANPSPVTSVTIQIAGNAPSWKVNQVYEMLGRNGWPKTRVRVLPWHEKAKH